MIRKSLKLLFITTLLSCLAFITGLTFIALTLQTTENHSLAKFPEKPTGISDIEFFVRSFDAWWSDAIHFRQSLIIAYNTMRALIGISPQRDVIIGKDGWLFYNAEGSIEDYRNSHPLTKDEIKRWRLYLLYRHTDAEKHGAKYIFFVAPNKERIYGEYLPANIRQLSATTRFDQIIEAMRDTPVRIVDLRQPLLAAKNTSEIYFRLDTHWNLLGANIAQFQIIKNLSEFYPDLVPYIYPSDAFYFADAADFLKAGVSYPSGLKYTLGNIPLFPDRKEPLFKHSINGCTQAIEPVIPPTWQFLPTEQKNSLFRATRCVTGKHRVIISHDSFTEALMPYFSATFESVYYIALPKQIHSEHWEYLVTTIKPDIILEESVERYLPEPPLEGADYPTGFYLDPTTHANTHAP